MDVYTVARTDNGCIEVRSKHNRYLVYRIPYRALKTKQVDIGILNRFVVYILHHANPDGKDELYIGKSKNGIEGRPVSHEEKNIPWTECFILTEEQGGFFNDGVIQYLEDEICSRFKSSGTYDVQTKVTTSGTANKSDIEDCKIFLRYAYPALETLGLSIPPVANADPTLDDFHQKVKKPSRVDVDPLDMSDDMRELYYRIESCLLGIDGNLRMAVQPKWSYVRFSFPDIKKTLVYCRYLKKDGAFEMHVIGEPKWYGGLGVRPAGPGDKYGACATVFIVRRPSDIERVKSICSIGYDRIMNGRH